MFVAGHFIGPPTGLLITLYLYVLDPHPAPHLWILVGGLCVFFPLPLLLRATRRFDLLCVASVQILAFVVLFGSYHYGGASSPFLCWLAVIPLLAFFYLGPSPVACRSVLSCLAAYGAGFYGIQLGGHEFPAHVSIERLSGAGIVSILCATAFVSLMALYYAQVVEQSAKLIAARHEAEEEKERAQLANHAKSDFLARMSHELRTPLHSILGFAQLLDFSSKQPLTPTQRQQVAHIKRAGTLLLSLINEVLDLSKIESGQIPISLEHVAITALLRELEATIRPLAERAGLNFHIDRQDNGSTGIRADRTRLLQVLTNLCTNAIKYNSSGGSVTIVVMPAGPELIRISVRDTGIGIPTEKQSELYQPFNRLGAEQSGIEGTGIGLSIAHRLIAMMSGKLSFESAIGRGTTFHADLPTSAGALPSAAPIQTTSPGWDTARNATILYVEDNPDNRALMQSIIDNLPGLCMKTASDGTTGLEVAAACPPDLIVLDVNLPDLSGFEVLHRLKSSARTSTIPVIALSAAAMPRDVERGLAAGFRCYLTKPIESRASLPQSSSRSVSTHERRTNARPPQGGKNSRS